MNVDFFVANRKVTAKGRPVLTADTAGCDTFTVSFDREWDGLVKMVVLQNGANKVQVLYTGKTPLPRQVCGRGDLYLTCFGYRSKDDGAAVIRTQPMIRPVHMLGAAAAEGDMTQPYTPSLLEQIMAQVAAAQQAGDYARQVGQTIEKLHAQGAFRGEPGPAGQAATVQVERVCRGEEAGVENLGTARNAVLRFTLPYGLTEAEKEALKAQIVGDIDTALDHILALQQSLVGGETV